MRIYTRKGDGGETAMLGGGRVPKSDARIRALGTLDELNAALGLALAETDFPEALRGALARVQNVLFEAGAVLASSDATAHELFARETAWLEETIDGWESELPALTRFVLPGGSRAGSTLHWVRTVARRGECQVVEAFAADPARLTVLTWLNRLSDALFVAARTANRLAGIGETEWVSTRETGRGGSSA